MTQYAQCMASSFDATDNFWKLHNCDDVVAAELNSNAAGLIRPDRESIIRVRKDMQKRLNRYTVSNSFAPTANPYQETIISTCSNPKIYGVCDIFLTTYCPTFSKTELDASLPLASLCGCYLSSDSGTSLIELGCSGYCNQPYVVQRVKADGDAVRCPITVCAIDDVNVDLTGSRVNGQLNILNFCPSCTEKGKCSCYISDVNVDPELGWNLASYCDLETSQCTQDGKRVPCASVLPTSAPSRGGVRRVSWIVGVLLIVLLLGAVFIILGTRSRKEN